jgi:hypothetical protein
MVLPNFPWAIKSTDTQVTRQDLDVADRSTMNQTSCATPHRPPHLHLSRTNSIPTSTGLPTTPGPTCNTNQSQRYRILPIIAGILIPLSILLSIPSLTNQWHVQTDGNVALEARPRTLHHIVAMSLSMACGVLANICLVLRFAERSVKKMTLLCIVLLSINGSCLSSRLLFLLTDINRRIYKYNCAHYIRGDSSLYRGIRLRAIILDDHLLNGGFNDDQHHAHHRLLSYKKIYQVRYVIRYLLLDYFYN